MTRLEVMNENKKMFEYVSGLYNGMHRYSDHELDKIVVAQLIFPWIKGNKWMGGMSDSLRNKAYERIMALGYTYEQVEETEQVWMQKCVDWMNSRK